MSPEELFSKMKGIFPDRKRRRNSNCADSGPPPKVVKNVPERRLVHNEPFRPHQMSKSFMGSMGAFLSKFTTHSNACEPTKYEEYSDGEEITILQTFRKNDLAAASRYHQTVNYRPDKMDSVNNKACAATRPPPGLIPKSKWSRVPDLQKYKPPPPSMISARPPPRLNGYPCDNETNSTRNTLVNGNSLSFKSHNSQHLDSTSNTRRNFSNYMNSASSFGPKYTTTTSLNSIQKDAEDKLRYARLLNSFRPDCGHNIADPVPLPTSKRSSIVQNHVISARQPLRKSLIHILDDGFLKNQEDTRRLFSESSIHTERQVTPVNTMLLKIESTPVCHKSFPDCVKEKYSAGMRQRQEKIFQQEETSNQLSSIRLKNCSSYESLLPAWRTPDVVIFPEDLDEKVDDFPEFSDSQKQAIRQAMTGGNIHSVLISKFNFQITRDHIHTLQWEPLAWLNDEVINFYMSLLTERGDLRAGDDYPKVYAMNTFFLQRLCAGGYSAVKRWTKKVDIFACDIIPVPVHVSNVHWCMAIINMKEKTIKYYDSMGSPNNRVLSALEEYLREESLDKRKIEFDMSGWSKENVTDNPHQKNGSDCGVFSCMTAEFICRNRPIVFNQQHMNYFRQKMVLEICTGKMLL